MHRRGPPPAVVGGTQLPRALDDRADGAVAAADEVLHRGDGQRRDVVLAVLQEVSNPPQGQVG